MSYQFDESMICPWDATATTKRINQYRSYYKVKHDICAELRPETIVEIGVRAGYSAYYFLQACPDATYWGFDADNGTHGGQGPKPYYPWAIEILRKAGRDFNLVIPFDTQKATSLPIKLADFYHIDGDHTTVGVMSDLGICFKHCLRGGHLLVDDYDYLREVREGVDAWLKLHEGKVEHEYRKSLRGEMLIRKL